QLLSQIPHLRHREAKHLSKAAEDRKWTVRALLYDQLPRPLLALQLGFVFFDVVLDPIIRPGKPKSAVETVDDHGCVADERVFKVAVTRRTRVVKEHPPPRPLDGGFVDDHQLPWPRLCPEAPAQFRDNP